MSRRTQSNKGPFLFRGTRTRRQAAPTGRSSAWSTTAVTLPVAVARRAPVAACRYSGRPIVAMNTDVTARRVHLGTPWSRRSP